MRNTTEFEIRASERWLNARKEYNKATKTGKIAYKYLVTEAYKLIPKGFRDMLKSIKFNIKKSLSLPPSLPSGRASFKRLSEGNYMKQSRKNHEIYLLMQ